MDLSSLSPLRGLLFFLEPVPRAYAWGYMLPPLRGYSRPENPLSDDSEIVNQCASPLARECQRVGNSFARRSGDAETQIAFAT